MVDKEACNPFPEIAQFIAKWKSEVEPAGGRVLLV